MADTMGTLEASRKWGYTQATIRKWCKVGLIKNASRDKEGSPWHIPKDAICPKPALWLRRKDCRNANPD